MSGLLYLSTGVGTVMMYILQSFKSDDSFVKLILDDCNSLFDTSSVLSIPFSRSLILATFLSKPIVEYFLLNSMAKGKPT